MFSRVRIAIRFFFVGLAVGVLLAPRSGVDTRRLLRQRADQWLNDLLDAATLGSFRPGSQTAGGRTRTDATAESAETPEEALESSAGAVVGGD
jgi:gas vesicle protein